MTLSLTAPVAAAGVGVEFRGESGVTSLPGATGTVVEAFGRAVDTLVEAAGAPPAGRGVACDAAFGLRVTEILAELEEVLGARG